jgi:tetratricopeptide (TPR) repeat protein
MHEDELRQVKELFEKHGMTVAVVGGVLLVALIGAAWFRRNREMKLQRSSSLLSAARSQEDLQSVMTRYPKTPHAALAALRIAKMHYDMGRYEESSAAYDEFQQKFPEHEFAAGAQLGKAHCLEAKQQYKRALAAFSDFIAGHPEHFLTPQAVFGKGRCLELLGREEEARILYEDFIAANAESGWTLLAEEMREAIGMRTAPPPGASGPAFPWGGPTDGPGPISIPVGPQVTPPGAVPEAGTEPPAEGTEPSAEKPEGTVPPPEPGENAGPEAALPAQKEPPAAQPETPAPGAAETPAR